MMRLETGALPGPLAALVEEQCQHLVEAGVSMPAPFWPELTRVLAGSDYVAEQLRRLPGLAAWLAHPGRLEKRLDPVQLREEVDEALQGCTDEAALSAALRRIRHHHMCRIIWRDLTPRGHYSDTVHDLSLLANTLIDRALSVLYGWACEREGTPMGPDGRSVQLVVLAMGKLGAGELNLSSDIDLIFAYEHEGELPDHRRGMTHNQFFTRLGQQLIKVLDQVTADGFVFRVDMRLRPWGKAGALAIGFDAMEGYYESQGREWERYALIKARPVAGDREAGERLCRRLHPFVFRRYIDFGAFESLREMKGMIEREVQRKGIQHDVKLGPGGIREVEFIVQAFQLIRGGQVPELRDPRLLVTLPRLADEGLMPAEVVQELREAYIYLRDVEHRLQAVADRQTQRLPDDELGWLRLAWAMDCRDRAQFEQRLEQVRGRVRLHFANVIADPDDAHGSQRESDSAVHDVWLGSLPDEDGASILAGLGIQDAAEVVALLAEFRDSRTVTNMQTIGRERLDRLMPLLIEELGYQGQGQVTTGRLLGFVEAVVRRSAYIALLVENPGALAQLVKLSAASPWIADQVTRHPVLLDELLNVGTLYAPPGRRELDDELRQHLLRVAEDDLEQQMERLRHFKQAHLLRVAASEVVEVLPLMKVSDYLTWLAESLVSEVVKLAWAAMVKKHGRPARVDGTPCEPDFIVLGYGKLGGIELSYNSDLDLVFLHDADPDGETDGDRPTSNQQFFARLAQRMIHILTTRTMSGQLYEVDARLRPSGNAGQMVASLDAFARYQHDQAWTWEHQALVRARVVAGCGRAAARFAEIRHDILARARDEGELRREVLEMREKMVQHLGSKQAGRFNIKHDPGGIVDIEFMVQYGVLRWASHHGELTRVTDNVRLLETLAALGLLSAQDAGLLREAYLAFRSAAHRLALRMESAEVDDTEFGELRDGVRAVWTKLFQL